MLSLSTPKPISLPLPTTHHHNKPRRTPLITCSSSSPGQFNLIIPKTASSYAQPQQLYQPYRPPPTPLPSRFTSLDTASIIEVLSNRLGLWYEYAPLIDTLFRDGFTPPSIEELTGISGVEQNRLVVAAQVRHSIADTLDFEQDLDVLQFFDGGGSELLYELRLLSTSQRADAAKFLVRRRLDGEKAKELSRSIKDFPMRRGEAGWECFDYARPGDCWAFTYLRLSREFMEKPEKRATVLDTAAEVAESERAIERIREEMEGKVVPVDEKEAEVAVKVPVVRLRMGEVAEATTVVVLPVCEGKGGGDAVREVPVECRSVGDFGVVVADKVWDRWMVLPRWAPVAGVTSGVAVAFPDAKALPWRVNRTYLQEPILVVTDRARKEVEFDEGFYLAALGDSAGELKVLKGSSLKEMGVSESLGTVVIVVRPPKDEDDGMLSDEDWD